MRSEEKVSYIQCVLIDRSRGKNQKYVVQHINKFAYVKKKQYLCTMKTRTIVNIILAVIACALLNLLIIRAILRMLDIA